MADGGDLADSFLALVDEAFGRLMDEPDARLHVTGFAEGHVAFVLTRDGLEVWRLAVTASCVTSGQRIRMR
jgi:hypothetical protein